MPHQTLSHPAGTGPKAPLADCTLYQLSDDPYPHLARLRERAPVAWFPDTGMWLVTRYDDVLAVLRDTETFTTDHPGSPIQDIFGRQMLSIDGDLQKRYKAACIHPFAKKSIKDGLDAVVVSKVDRLLLSFEWQGQADLRTALTGPLSVYSVARVLGIPDEFHGMIYHWYEHFARALANFTQDADARIRGQTAAAEFRAAMRPLLQRAAAEPDAGLFSTLVHASDRLQDEEILSNALIILFGGIETTDSMMANAAYALLTDRESLDRLRDDASLWPNAIEESLRWEPAVQSCTRFATRETEIAGIRIPAGETVQCMIGGANRDPARFPDPDRFDIARTNADEHLSFGIGRHLCLGAHLARAEAMAVVPTIFARLRELRLDAEHPARPTGYEFRRPSHLKVRWTVTG